MAKLSVIIPCYNEQEVLPIFYEELKKGVSGIDAQSEFIFIDDGSRDGTLNVLKGFAEKDDRVKYISFSRNFGKEAAMYAGFINAGGDYVALMDADMQDPPSLLAEMFDALQSPDYDIAATRRVTRKGEPALRSAFAKLFYKIINKVSDADIMDGARDFRMMKRNVADAVCALSEYNRFSKGIFGWVGFKTKWIPYENIERAAGKTKWSFWGLCKYALSGIVNFSELPLSAVSCGGFIMTLLSFLALIFIIIRKLCFGDPVDGWASIVCIVIFIGGIELLCLGTIGQYISKTYTESKKRPHFIIADTNKQDTQKVG